MSTYHFPIILGQNEDERIVMIHLNNVTKSEEKKAEDKASEEKKAKDEYEENRVVACSGNQDAPLFKIPKDVMLIDDNGGTTAIKMGEDFKVYDASDATSPIELSPHQNPNGEYEFTVIDNIDGIFDGIMSFKYKNDFVGTLCIVRTDRVLNLNVDLGSEATQAWCYSSLFKTGKPAMVGLVDVLKDFYVKKGRKYDELVATEGQPLFTQEEVGSPNFYKTGNITFYYDEENKGIGNLQINDDEIEAWLEDKLTQSTSTGHSTSSTGSGTEDSKTDASNSAFINYLNVSAAGKNKNESKKDLWESIEKKYVKKLINIKILYANMARLGRYVGNISFKQDSATAVINNEIVLLEVLRSIYKQIIVSSVKAIATKFMLDLERVDVISVLILVPNIYNQWAIDHLLHDLNKLNKPKEGEAKAKLRFDFRVISESDAAFLGIKNRNILKTVTKGIKSEKKKDFYLVIDSGKGTTDFSIIHHNPGDTVNPVYSVQRGGVAGAGGAIDYVFARIVARQLYAQYTKSAKCSVKTFVSRFMELFTKMSPDYQDKLMRVVELTKIQYDGHSIPNVKPCFLENVIVTLLKDEDQDPEWSAITADSSWKSISNWKWNGHDRRDVEEKDVKEVDKVCHMIAEIIIQKVFENEESLAKRIDYVIFTGRSFKFKPLRDAFEKTLKGKRGFYEENMTLPLEAGFYMLCRWFNETIRKKSSEIAEKHVNLKVAPMEGYSMKEISVRFSDHNLGCNCNSDLCCISGLQIKKDGEYRFGMKQFWEGFTDSNNKKVYYLGYPSHSFSNKKTGIDDADADGIDNDADADAMKTQKALIDMTLFPIQYNPVDLETGGQQDPSKQDNSQTANADGKTNENGGTPQEGTKVGAGNPQDNTNSIEDVDSFATN